MQIWTVNEQDCYDAGFANGKDFWVAEERERITKNIQSRIQDLRSCGKKDNCQELADLIEDYIPEWIEDSDE